MKSLKLLSAASMLFFIHAANSYAASFATDATASQATQRYSIYQNPDGSYPSLSNLVRDVEGTPCGIECEQDADRRWGLRPAHGDHARRDYYGYYGH
jgi:hypothetical protein